ncbi:50S ribosomal protein L4, partial [Candidatus Bathyarchaeota archaeon]|nr:50S ribosomal protein L4 [Candidatus Bathyarchaeota archaeon]
TAVAATADRIIVTSRGHVVNGVKEFPLVVTDEIQKLKKTRKALDAFSQLGLSSDIYRVKKSRGVRAGKGKRRGRKMKQAVGPLLIVAANKGISKAGNNIPGVDVVEVNNLNTEMLAPGTYPGRLTLWSIGALTQLDKLYFGGQN